MSLARSVVPAIAGALFATTLLVCSGEVPGAGGDTFEPDAGTPAPSSQTFDVACDKERSAETDPSTGGRVFYGTVAVPGLRADGAARISATRCGPTYIGNTKAMPDDFPHGDDAPLPACEAAPWYLAEEGTVVVECGRRPIGTWTNGTRWSTAFVRVTAD